MDFVFGVRTGRSDRAEVFGVAVHDFRHRINCAFDLAAERFDRRVGFGRLELRQLVDQLFARVVHAVPFRAPQVAVGGFTFSRALVKTVTFRTLATIMDFTTNYVVVGNVGQAVILSATGFVLGPFVYYGHEKAWDYFGERKQADGASGETRLRPAQA